MWRWPPSSAPSAGPRAENLARVEEHVREAAAQGANVVLPPELFEGPYFCREEKREWFAEARALEDDEAVARMRDVARELGVVIPVSFFERAGQAYYNSVAIVDADGSVLGVYRKSHIPDGPGYEEKFYFRPGDTGFRVWPTRFGRLGVGICWDQWFPESARAMMLLGAEVLFYPTAIGSEPHDPDLDTRDPWQRAMIGHAVSNVVPVVAANRIGVEAGQRFYGSSFIADPRGDKLAELGRDDEGVIVATFDLDALAQTRASWGFFRDRRPELYGVLTTADGDDVAPRSRARARRSRCARRFAANRSCAGPRQSAPPRCDGNRMPHWPPGISLRADVRGAPMMLRHQAPTGERCSGPSCSFPAVGFAPYVEPRLIPVAPAAQPLLRLLRGRLQPQPQPLPDVQEPADERLLLGVAQRLLRLPDVRVDPDAQPESPQVREQGRRRDDHLALLEEEHLARREHVLLRLGVLAGRPAQASTSPRRGHEPARSTGRSSRSTRRSSARTRRSSRSRSALRGVAASAARRLALRLRASRRSSRTGR